MKPPFCNHLSRAIVKNLKKNLKISTRCEFPHLREEVDPTVKLWTCCECLKTGCSRFSVNRCMEIHSNQTKHSICYNPADSLLWCYECDKELHENIIENEANGNVPSFKEFEENVKSVDEIFFGQKRSSMMLNPNSPPVERAPSLPTFSNSRAKDNIFGLSNLGNTCFFNSCMQVILNTPELINSLASVQSKLGPESMAANLVELAQPSGENYKTPRTVFNKLIRQNKMYGYYGQQDSHEAFVTILEILEKEAKNANVELDIPFQSFLIYNSLCLKCSKSEWLFEENFGMMIDVKEQTEHPLVLEQLYKYLAKFRDIQPFTLIENKEIVKNKNVEKSGIDIKNDKLFVYNKWNYFDETNELEKLIHQFFDYTIYSFEKNKYQCDRCKDKSNFGYTKYYILEPPLVFTLCLKKFKKSSYSYQKYSKSITFVEKLDFSRYVIRKNSNNLKESYIYELYGAVQHSGSLSGGHYTCYVKKESGQWYYVSDSHFSPSSLKDALTSDAYLLFYKRCK